MKFTPKSEKEIAEDNLWPAGEYGFEVVERVNLGGTELETCDRVSKAGNEMIQLVLKVYHPEGHFITVLDFLMEKIAYKLRHAADACGLMDHYTVGVLEAKDFVGKTGYLKLKIGKSNGDYPAKNEVADYLVPQIGDERPSPVLQREVPEDHFPGDLMPWEA